MHVRDIPVVGCCMLLFIVCRVTLRCMYYCLSLATLSLQNRFFSLESLYYLISIICKWRKQWRDVVGSLSLLVRRRACACGRSGRSTSVRRLSARVTDFYASRMNKLPTAFYSDCLTCFAGL